MLIGMCHSMAPQEDQFSSEDFQALISLMMTRVKLAGYSAVLGHCGCYNIREILRRGSNGEHKIIPGFGPDSWLSMVMAQMPVVVHYSKWGKFEFTSTKS